LIRLCMSLPEGLQANVRAQLADCLVAVCCQRLEFLSAQRLHVPRCEVLLPTSGAKGTIRSGNFSHIATVLQSGGEEGMWTFERYQRWMDQVTDWVRPPSAAALRAQVEATPARAPSLRAARSLAPGAGAATAGTAGSPSAAGAPNTPTRRAPEPPASGKRGPAEDLIEVPAEDMDLASLAELAKKVVERKPP
jgi:twitching motility protein PilT